MRGRISSEEDLIERYLRPLAAGFPGAFDLMDDCAALQPVAGEDLVLSVDAVAAGVHFFADDDAADIGWKALAVNVSDLAGKGARPVAYLMSLAFAEAPEHAWMASFAKGLAEAQAAFGIALAGGDTDRRAGPTSITITAIGAVPAQRYLTRRDAHAGDALFVSGTLGDAALGLRLRRRDGSGSSWGLPVEQQAELVSRYLRPQPRLGLRTALLSCASAAMDISDGLAKDLGRLCKASGLGAAVALNDLPLSKAAAAVVQADPADWQLVVGGGDDYEILAAVPESLATDFREMAAAGGVEVTQIGMLDGRDGVSLVSPDGAPFALAHTGWEHFAG